MELAIGALTSLAGSLGLTGPATATAAGAATATGGSFLTTLLQGGASALSALGAIRAANTKADAYKLQAEDAVFDAKSEEIAGIDRQTAFRRTLLKTLGDRDAAYAAGGVDLTFGTPAISREQAVDEANAAVLRDEGQTATRAARLRERAAGFRRLAEDARASGRIEALGSAFDFGLSAMKRG